MASSKKTPEVVLVFLGILKGHVGVLLFGNDWFWSSRFVPEGFRKREEESLLPMLKLNPKKHELWVMQMPYEVGSRTAPFLFLISKTRSE